ncbi:hypothetical protein HK101_009404 [Irineochytrium annulatum]|nr:hypothetical protein HK101_009404 [Irineochytrium annulatum]
MSQAVQDRPPANGFPQTIAFKRNIPLRGPSGAVIFLATIGIMGYGFYWIGQSNAERRELRREKLWARIHLVPLLQAETDRDAVRRLESLKNNEAKIMEDVPGWVPMSLTDPVPGLGKRGERDNRAAEPVYHTKRHVAPNYVFLPADDEKRIDAQWWRGTKIFLRNPPYHERADWREKADV